MKLSKERKAYVVFLGLALAAVVIDRAFLASDSIGPDQANAAGEKGLSTTLPGRIGALLAESASKRSLTDHLQAVCEAEEINFSDLKTTFASLQSWVKGAQHEDPSPSTQPNEPDKAEAFKRQHELMAVMVTADGARAIVNNRCLLIGQELDGFRLISVGLRSAILESETARVELKIESNGEARRAN